MVDQVKRGSTCTTILLRELINWLYPKYDTEEVCGQIGVTVFGSSLQSDITGQ